MIIPRTISLQCASRAADPLSPIRGGNFASLQARNIYTAAYNRARGSPEKSTRAGFTNRLIEA